MGKKGKNKKDQPAEENKQVQDEPMPPEKEPNNQEEVTEEIKDIVIPPRKIQYCPICSYQFELCKFSKKAKDCKKFLQQVAPQKVAKYFPDKVEGGEQADFEKKQEENLKEQMKEQVKAEKPVKISKKDKSVKDKYIVIDVKQRQKKKYTTTATGLSIFKIDSKEMAKKLGKKLASSCSSTDANSIQALGDFYEQIREMLITDYGVKKKYILDSDQFKEKVNLEKEKKKEQQKLEEKVIKEEENEDQQQHQQEEKKPKVNYRTAGEKLLADLEESDQEQI